MQAWAVPGPGGGRTGLLLDFRTPNFGVICKASFLGLLLGIQVGRGHSRL